MKRTKNLKDDIFADFLDHLKVEVAQRFPKREEELDREEIQLANELSKMLRAYLIHLDILPKGDLPFGQGNEPSKDGRQKREEKKKRPERPRKPEPKEEERIRAILKTDKPIRRTRRTNYGFDEVYMPEGNEKPPMYFHPPNMVIHNTSNDLYIFSKKNKVSMGPKWLRILPWLARTAVCMNPQYKKWDIERIDTATDQAMRYFLTQKGEITS